MSKTEKCFLAASPALGILGLLWPGKGRGQRNERSCRVTLARVKPSCVGTPGSSLDSLQTDTLKVQDLLSGVEEVLERGVLFSKFHLEVPSFLWILVII